MLILYRQSKEWPRSLDAMEGGSTTLTSIAGYVKTMAATIKG